MIEVFRRKKRFFLVFEYLEHTVLEELEARSGGLGFVTSRKYIFQILRALDFIHSNNVIHRDIKPENVLVSRLGVIKLCDFGFARPYAENETFTDYVATRWYRSPELLVGDPRYGKEVDIWAVGCLYSEMMTGEPLFPGESDIDQLFQIVRVLGKLNSRHQLLVTRNTMFKGMKQEKNSSLAQLFPDWNRDSLDFLTQCLKMDGNQRPETTILLKHDLFGRDDFLDTFLPELRSKISQEVQRNPLLIRHQGFGSGRKITEEKRNSIGEKTKKDESKPVSNPKDRIAQIGLSLFPASQITNNNKILETNLKNEELHFNLSSYKHYLTSNKNLNSNVRPININNLTFKDSGGKYARVLSAKPQRTNLIEKMQQSTQTNLDLQIQPPSPVQFQSLQPEIQSEQKSQQCSPINLNNLTIGGNLPQYKKNSNVFGLHGLQKVGGTKQSPLNFGARTNLAKRDRGLLLDTGLSPFLFGTTNTDVSPRVLPPPPWLTGTSNLKITSQGKTTQIGKRGVVTDWKTITNGGSKNNGENNDFIFPNCPGGLFGVFYGVLKFLMMFF